MGARRAFVAGGVPHRIGGAFLHLVTMLEVHSNSTHRLRRAQDDRGERVVATPLATVLSRC